MNRTFIVRLAPNNRYATYPSVVEYLDDHTYQVYTSDRYHRNRDRLPLCWELT